MVPQCYILCLYVYGLKHYGKELFIRLTVCVFHGRLSNFVCVLLSLLVMRVGCGM